MIDRKILRRHADIVKDGMSKRQYSIDIDEVCKIDEQWTKMQHHLETLRCQRNKVAMRSKESEQKLPSHAVQEARELAKKIREMEIELQELEKDLGDWLLTIPNIPDHTVPVGFGEGDNRVVRKWGEIREDTFILSHEKIGEKAGIIDLGRASKISGARFGLYFDLGAMMQKALINFMIDTHVRENGYTFVWPPFMVLRESMITTGQLPKFKDDLFYTADHEMYLVPTAEVPLTNIHRDEIIPESKLPLKYVAYTPCFRKEAGSYGKDTKGIIRQHQFEKVELVKFTTPQTSFEELESMVRDAERVLRYLSLPYQVVELCTADLGFAAAKTFDIEVWFPSQQKYREVSSCSNCTDFQARRGKIRFRHQHSKKVELLHTLNGSGVAIGRVMAAILENYQTSQGSVIIPEKLRPYMYDVTEIGIQ